MACNYQSQKFDDCILETIDSGFVKKGEGFSEYLIQNEILTDLTFDGLRNLILTAEDDHDSKIAIVFERFEGKGAGFLISMSLIIAAELLKIKMPRCWKFVRHSIHTIIRL